MKALFVMLAALFVGVIGMAVGHEIFGGFPELGSVAAVAVTGALIIHFLDRKQ